ncbi:head GIN domain-containing protein [Hyunsoonleella rubra]|uniref:Head GIN domain-containing protein n=1 Tax=Hyunsoonleella rubra TaxID=1737062 RepID=A0ABW5TEB8_9FLAO
MTTLIKIIIASVLSLSLFSCNFDINLNPGVTGNGNVITETRNVTESFNSIKATEGLDVYITQGNSEKIIVEADENVMGLIETEIKNGVLKIHTSENIGRATKQVNVHFKDVTSLISTSGSDIYSTNTISAESLSLRSTSGSDMKVSVDTQTLNCESTSGSNQKISGKTVKLTATATSGSDIKAGDLIAESSNVKATSGAGITVNTSKELIANANSGGDIRYYGNPKKVDANKNSAGSIRKK